MSMQHTAHRTPHTASPRLLSPLPSSSLSPPHVPLSNQLHGGRRVSHSAGVETVCLGAVHDPRTHSWSRHRGVGGGNGGGDCPEGEEDGERERKRHRTRADGELI